jgi:hypothetical protein
MVKQNERRASGAFLAALVLIAVLAPRATGEEQLDEFDLRVSWGHEEGAPESPLLRIIPSHVELIRAKTVEGDVRETDGQQGHAWSTEGGVASVHTRWRYPDEEVDVLDNVHSIWQVLLQKSERQVAERLRQDPAIRRDRRRLTFHLDSKGMRGFTLTVDQLLNARQLWIPALGVYLDAGSEPVPLEKHLATIAPDVGQRTREQIAAAPEATYEQFRTVWEDMGSPRYRNRWAVGPGHIVGLTWDSAIPKFGVDRGAGVWNDRGNPDHFRLWFEGHDPAGDVAAVWKDQRLAEALPLMTTEFQREGLRYEIEQFAYPLHGPPPERRGDIAMVLLQRVRLVNRTDQEQRPSLTLNHHRRLPAEAELQVEQHGSVYCLVHTASRETLLALAGLEHPPEIAQSQQGEDGTLRVALTLRSDLAAEGQSDFVIKLPSPLVPKEQREALLQLDYTAARAATIEFWTEWERRGAQFQVPEQAVNQLFRASLWHALRLPRRHGGPEPSVRIDLPYSNFAYGQTGSDWPVNQAVYVDYMIYGLRGYYDVATEELAAMFRNNQQPNGRVTGYANWLVYTPSMLYTIAENYLLSQDPDTLEPLLASSLAALDWCLEQIELAGEQTGPALGVVRGPLNDLTGDGYWAFNQAYLYAGLERFGRALERYGHPRAAESLAAADRLRTAIEAAFRRATVLSPLVPLRDRTWSPYVPSQVTRPGRLMDIWYPTDVDTGALHLVRLGALAAESDLAEYLLDDHEDNLFLHQAGMANEPVYNQHGTAYLLRDEPEAVIRTFYSMMACAFSHTVFEPVEHRWGWGEYFGPPSTSGAWLELYRRMLIHETDDNQLLLLQATPRQWLEHGQKIVISGAPTYYGTLSLTVESLVEQGEIRVELEMSTAYRPRALLVRLRHPEGKTLRGVMVDGQEWTNFDVDRQWVRIENPDRQQYSIVGRY